MKLWQEIRRRRVLRLAGLYVVGAWLILQVAATFFPAWGIPDEALRYLIIAAVVAFPVAVVFGWLFDITSDGIVRTPPAGDAGNADYSLKRTDFAIIAALAVVALAVVYGSIEKVVETTSEEIAAREKLPNSVAVIPFMNLDDKPGSDYFSDGVTEEILHRLSETKTIRVLGHASSFPFKESDMTAARISAVLGVRYLLQGSIRRDGTQIRVRASLVDDAGLQVWSESFDREVRSVFAVQSEIAHLVVRKLVDEIVPTEKPAGRATDIPEAYEQYLIGRDYLRSRVPNYHSLAAEAFNRALDMDPDYAPAHAGLAIAVTLGSRNDIGRQGEHLDRAQEHVTRALQLVPDLAEGHAAQGLVLEFGQNADFVAAEDALRRTIDLDPTLINAYNWLSIALRRQGRLDEASQVIEAALEIDPLNPIINANAATSYATRGDFRGAEKRLLRLMDLPQPPATAFVSLANLYGEYGRFAKAVEWGKKRALAFGGKPSPWAMSNLGNTYLHVGMDEAADYWIDKSMEIDAHGVNNFFREIYRLKVRGQYEEMGHLKEDFFAKNPIDVSRLSEFAAEIISALYIMTDDTDPGIALMEQIIETREPVSNATGASATAVDFMQLLAYTYRQVGRNEDADRLLAKGRNNLDLIKKLHNAASPHYLEVLTLQYVLSGETESAVRTFEQAVDTGWRNYNFTRHDARWREFFELPAVSSQLAFVRADMERQREQIEALDAQSNFREIVEQNLAQ